MQNKSIIILTDLYLNLEHFKVTEFHIFIKTLSIS
jgi:hypothetical protein